MEDTAQGPASASLRWAMTLNSEDGAPDVVVFVCPVCGEKLFATPDVSDLRDAPANGQATTTLRKICERAALREMKRHLSRTEGDCAGGYSASCAMGLLHTSIAGVFWLSSDDADTVQRLTMEDMRRMDKDAAERIQSLEGELLAAREHKRQVESLLLAADTLDLPF